MSRIPNNIKAFIGVFSFCERVVANHFLNIFNTSPIYNSINKICICDINFVPSVPILIIIQPNISVVDGSVFRGGIVANYGTCEAQII